MPVGVGSAALGAGALLGGGGGPSSSTTSNPSPWTRKQWEPLSQQIQGLTNKPFTPYGQPMVAGLDPLQTQAAGMAQANVGAGQGVLAQAVSGASGAAGFQPTHVGVGQIADADLSKYRNPFEDQVVGNTMADLERQRQQAIMQGQGAAAHAGAFGGSRHGVADSLTNEAALRTAASTSAGLRQAGYDRATALAGQDIDRRYSADLANQGADQSAAALRLSGAGLLGNLAAQQQGMGQSDAEFLNRFGQQARDAVQQGLGAQYSEFLRQQGATQQQIDNLLRLQGQIPGGTTQTSSGSPGLFSTLGTLASGFGSLGWKPFG